MIGHDERKLEMPQCAGALIGTTIGAETGAETEADADGCAFAAESRVRKKDDEGIRSAMVG